ncbi:MAG: NifB/NifX family molybdenum-iron cluster-binding protein [Desulfatibacillaceae bacterium]
MPVAIYTVMKVAIPYWQGRVSPVFDFSTNLLIVDCRDGKTLDSYRLHITGHGAPSRAARIRMEGVELLICGALSRLAEESLAASGIRVIPGVCGPVEDILHAYLENRLASPAFSLPGTRPDRFMGKEEVTGD